MQTELFLRAGLYRNHQYAQHMSPGAGPGPHSDAGQWDSASPPSPKPRLSVLSSRPEVKGQGKLIKVRPFRRLASRRREKEGGGAGEGEAERREWDI